MKFKQNKRCLCFFAPLLAFASAAEASQFTTSQIPVPSSATAFMPSAGPYLDPVAPFESIAYFKGTKSTSRGVGTYTLQASNKASNVGLSGSNYALTWWADASHAYAVTSGVYDLNFRGTATGTNPGIAVSGNGCNNPGTCSNTVSVFGKGISASAADMTWLQSNEPAAYNVFTSSSANRNLFSATLTNFDIFGETTSGTTDDAIAFKWTDATGALADAGLADLYNFGYLGGLRTSNFLGSSTNFTDTQIYQHLNVPIPGAVWLFGSAFMFLSRGAIAGRRKYSV